MTKTFLTNRKFQIKVSNHLSTIRPIRAGVPQGSLLSTLLYIYFINDISLIPQIILSLFADDMMYYSHNHNKNYAILKLQRQVNEITEWLDIWRLRLNINKTITVMFEISLSNKRGKFKLKTKPSNRHKMQNT